MADYLKEDIAAEAVTQNIPAFSQFLHVAALTSGELLNYTNIGRETGVSAKVVRNYFQILEDTLLGFRVEPWRKVKKRRLIETEKFYLFDVGLTNYLARRSPKAGTLEFGHSLENYIGLKALLEEHPVEKAIIVALEKQPRILENKVEVLPWQYFLERLWSGELGI